MVIISRVVKENNLPCSSSEYNKESVCDACQQGKIHQLPFSRSISVSQAPLSWFIWMFGVLHPHLLEGRIVMLALSMILVNILGFVLFTTNLKCFISFTPFKVLLGAPSIGKSSLCKLIGVMSIKNSTHSSLILGSNTRSRALMNINKMVPLRTDIDTLLK
jgi:hypothetical protein